MSFCEQRLCSWVVEPANTWSNLGYIIVALMIWKANDSSQQPALFLPGFCSLVVGIASALFHGTGTRWAELLDVSAMYLISALFIAFSLFHLRHWSLWRLLVVYVGICTISIVMMIATNSSGIKMFAAHLVVAVGLEFKLFRTRGWSPAYRELRWMSIAFGLSYVCWLLDFHRIVCWPENHILGGHALWHLINASCLWFFYRYQKPYFTNREVAAGRSVV